VAAVVDEVRLKYPIDDTAILLTGASMGGYGAWDLATRCHVRFSAVAPVSGGGDPLRAEDLARLPFCVVHGAQDATVPVERSLEMIRALRRHGGEVREVIYPNAGHGDAAERAYAPGSELYDWFAAIIAPGRQVSPVALRGRVQTPAEGRLVEGECGKQGRGGIGLMLVEKSEQHMPWCDRWCPLGPGHR
jgi:pimeloyl-ACP methyl ester carboxylesterase